MEDGGHVVYPEDGVEMEERETTTVKRWFIGAAVLIMAGCSRQDFSRVVYTPGKAQGGRDHALAQATAEERSQKLAEALLKWNKQRSGTKNDYVLGAGDELDVAIFALEEPNNTAHLKRVISKEGLISLPWIGDIKAGQLSVRQLEAAIREAYAGRFIRNPQITVQVSQYRSADVVVTGGVRNPGIYYLTENASTVLEMLVKAGGLGQDASDEVLVIRGGQEAAAHAAGSKTNLHQMARDGAIDPAVFTQGQQVLPISIEKMIAGDLAQNVEIKPGDIVTVRSMAQSYVYVLGYVTRPGAFEMRGGQELDPLRAVALAGGLTPIGRGENSFLVRETPSGQLVIPIDLTRLARGNQAPMMLEPGDTLVVGSGLLARLSEFVRPSVGAGASFAAPAP